MTTLGQTDTSAPQEGPDALNIKHKVIAVLTWPFRRVYGWGKATLKNQERYKGYRFGREILIISIMVFGGNLAASRLSISLTDSVDAKLLVRNEAPLMRDDFVSFILFDERAPGGEARVMKRMICLEGDELRYDAAERYFYCNDVVVGYVKPRALDGSVLEPFAWTGTHIPAGYAYVGGGHKDSYDSRYFGLVSLDRLTRYEKLF